MTGVRSKLSIACLLFLIVAFGLSFAGRWHFMLDNLSSFRVHFVIGFLVLTGVFLITRQRFWSGLAVAGMLASLIPVAPWYLPVKEDGVDWVGNMTVISANISAHNNSADELVELVQGESPEILGVVELTPKLAQGLAALHEQYPHRLELPAKDHQGLGLYSRLPLVDARELTFRHGLPSAISAILATDGRQIEIIVAHPNAPITSSLAERRNLKLRFLAEYIRESGRDTIVLGDLNVAMWSPYYRDFERTSGLKNARTGQGVVGSWPPIRGLSVPIDHILATSAIVLREFRVLSPIGSDHLPVASQVSIGGRS